MFLFRLIRIFYHIFKKRDTSQSEKVNEFIIDLYKHLPETVRGMDPAHFYIGINKNEYKKSLFETDS